MKEFDRESLAVCTGKDGEPTCIAYQGKVFDVSNSKLWQGGIHQRRHSAGEDLTDDMDMAPHGVEVLERFEQVGVVKD